MPTASKPKLTMMKRATCLECLPKNSCISYLKAITFNAPSCWFNLITAVKTALVLPKGVRQIPTTI
jgi:hypothetical protein